MKKVLQIVIVLCIAFQGFAQNHETQKKEINKGIVLDDFLQFFIKEVLSKIEKSFKKCNWDESILTTVVSIAIVSFLGNITVKVLSVLEISQDLFKVIISSF